MDKDKKIDNALKNAKLFDDVNKDNKYVILSDLHLGIGNNNDNALKNANFLFEALKYYYENGYYVILDGDTFEITENSNIEYIKRAHENIMWILTQIHDAGKLVIIRGNHDMYLTPDMLATRTFSYTKAEIPFLKDVTIYDSAIINTNIIYYIMHGHQVLWQYQPKFNHIMNFLIRYLWAPFEKYMLKDPTSEIGGFENNDTVDKAFAAYGFLHNCIMICGHTHSVQLTTPNYYNIGGGVMPRCITCAEIIDGKYTPYKWSYVIKNTIVHIEKTELK